MLKAIGDLVGPQVILQKYEATGDDIEYLAVIEAEIQRHKNRNAKP